MDAAAKVRPSEGLAPNARSRLADVAVITCYLALALVVYGALWADLEHGYLVKSGSDQNMWEWFFAVTAHSVFDLENPLWTDLQNHPLGVNLMGNTVMFGLGVPLAPLTALFGPTLTWAIALTAGLVGTATGWYWVLSRHIARSQIGAAVGGALCGFAPPMISHGTAHPNFVGQFVLPFIVLMLIRIARGARPMRDGVLLGLLVTWQVFLGEEPLLVAATALAVYGLAYAASRPRVARAMLRPLAIGVGVGAAVTVPLVAFPLWWQFFGPMSYRALEHGSVGNDLAAFASFSSESLAGGTDVGELALNPTEENAFLGWPLLLLALVLAAWLWRVVAARAAAITALVMGWLSLGVSLKVAGTDTGVPGPWLLLSKLPLYESLLESRLAMACFPPIAVLIALGCDRVLAERVSGGVRWLVVWRASWVAIAVAALVPIAPTPLEVTRRPEAPAFFASGAWRSAVDTGSVVMVPLPDPGAAEALHWQVAAGLEFPLAEGYFVGPDGLQRRGTYGAIRRPTSRVLDAVADSGRTPRVGVLERAAALSDLRFWRADAVVLGPHRYHGALRTTVDALLGVAARRVGGVWVWDVRGLVP